MKRIIRVLLVEDSLADATLIFEVLKDEKIDIEMDVVRDGEEALDYLLQNPPYQNKQNPDLVLLDLNLPKKDGREVLTEMKEHPLLRIIPVVVLTTSQADEDIVKTYTLQASCYVTKPIDLEQFSKIVRSIDDFWFTAVRFPPLQ